MELAGKVCLVTGGASGIGAMTALAFSRAERKLQSQGEAHESIHPKCGRFLRQRISLELFTFSRMQASPRIVNAP